MKEAMFQGLLVTAAEGVNIKASQKEKPDFLCAECGGSARSEQAGGHMPDRFEHLERNDHCSLVSKNANHFPHPLAGQMRLRLVPWKEAFRRLLEASAILSV